MGHQDALQQKCCEFLMAGMPGRYLRVMPTFLSTAARLVTIVIKFLFVVESSDCRGDVHRGSSADEQILSHWLIGHLRLGPGRSAVFEVTELGPFLGNAGEVVIPYLNRQKHATNGSKPPTPRA